MRFVEKVAERLGVTHSLVRFPGHLKQLIGRLPEIIEKIRLRSDGAWFNSKVMDYCQDGGIEFAITAEKNINMLQAIEAIPDEKWEVFADEPDGKIPHR